MLRVPVTRVEGFAVPVKDAPNLLTGSKANLEVELVRRRPYSGAHLLTRTFMLSPVYIIPESCFHLYMGVLSGISCGVLIIG
jgi:hypothetical protein